MTFLENDDKILPRLFLRIKSVNILRSLSDGPKYAAVLSRESRCTYSYTIGLLKIFRDHGLVDFDRKGRVKMVSLTAAGTDLSESIGGVVSSLKRMKEWKSG